MSVIITVYSTVVRSFKGDDESQWETPDFGPPYSL